jgi:hypothetical protein
MNLGAFLFSAACIIAPMKEFQRAAVEEMSAAKNSFVRAASGHYSAPLHARLRGAIHTSCCRGENPEHEWSRRLVTSTAQSPW